MREIKFRAWDREDKCFIRMVQHDRIPTKNTRQGFRLITKFILCQYVGFKDSNGVPIYEGDILEWGYKNDTSIFRAKVVFGRHSAGRDSWGDELYTVGFFLEFYDKGISGIDHDKYKIIGNIFENPELIQYDPN